MKYLKSIFEAAEEKVELQDFCEMYLAYLIDDGFKVEVNRTSGFKNTLTIKIITEKGTKPTTWDNIKDKLIPFFTMLVKNYNIGVYPNQGRPFHPSWLESTVTLYTREQSPSIDINELIDDQPYTLNGIFLIELNVHPK